MSERTTPVQKRTKSTNLHLACANSFKRAANKRVKNRRAVNLSAGQGNAVPVKRVRRPVPNNSKVAGSGTGEGVTIGPDQVPGALEACLNVYSG